MDKEMEKIEAFDKIISDMANASYFESARDLSEKRLELICEYGVDRYYDNLNTQRRLEDLNQQLEWNKEELAKLIGKIESFDSFGIFVRVYVVIHIIITIIALLNGGM